MKDAHCDGSFSPRNASLSAKTGSSVSPAFTLILCLGNVLEDIGTRWNNQLATANYGILCACAKKYTQNLLIPNPHSKFHTIKKDSNLLKSSLDNLIHDVINSK